MKKKIVLFGVFIVLSMAQVAVFMSAYADLFAQCTLHDKMQILLHSLPQALMVSSWVMLPTFVAGLLHVWASGGWHRKFMIWYVTLVCMPMLLLCCLDWVLYGFWGFRLDATPFIYILDDPVEAAKESPWWAGVLTTVVLVVAGLIVWGLMHLLYPGRRRSYRLRPQGRRESVGYGLLNEAIGNFAMVLLTWILGAGCFGLMGIDSAYWSDYQPYNHAATNPIYSFFHSVRQQRVPLGEQYRMMSEAERQAAMDELQTLAMEHADALLTDTSALVRQQVEEQSGPTPPLWEEFGKPNILLLLFESFSGKACHYLYPEADAGIMPNYCQLMAEGMAFTNCYANSFRTERGIVSVLAGYPGQPTYSVMNDEARCHGLHYLTQPLADNGYQLEFVHGGDGRYCGLPNFLRSGGIELQIDRRAFPVEQHNCQWGMHDGNMFDYLLAEMRAEAESARQDSTGMSRQPYFKFMPTISSHEPFEVPMHRYDDPYLNSIAYTDSCLGAFVAELKRDTTIWNNLLIIGLPDHCYAQYPAGIQQSDPERYHIPMFWTGGVIREHVDVTTLCQQTDLSVTLLHQLGLQADGFTFGHDIFAIDAPHFAFYAWPDGFGFMTDSCRYVQDNWYDGHGLRGTDDPTGRAQRLGKAYLQTLYDDMNGLLR